MTVDDNEIRDLQAGGAAGRPDLMRQLFDLVTKGSRRSVFWKDCEGRFLGCDRNFAWLVGLSDPVEIVGKSDGELGWSAELSRVVGESVREALRVVDSVVLPGEIPGDGGGLSFRVTVDPLVDAAGDAVGLVGSVVTEDDRRLAGQELPREKLAELLRHQTTRLVETNERLVKVNAELATMSRAKSVFVANMNHEIRTPMNGVLGMLTLLSDLELDEEQRDYVDTAKSSAEELLSILNDVLDFSKIEIGTLALENVPCDVRAEVEDVAELFAAQAWTKGVEVVTDISHELPASVIGDPVRIRQILVHLVSNAVKFTERGQVCVRVECSMRRDSRDWVTITVEDTGAGIPLEKQDSLFEQFTQADSSMTRRHGGTGLGLAITRRLTELMDGSITLESEPGRGTKFEVTIPFRIEYSAPPYEEIDCPPTRALVLESSRTTCWAIVDALRGFGLDCEGFSEPGEVLDRLHADRESCDVLVLGAWSGEPGLLSLVAQLKSDPLLSGLPFVWVAPPDQSLDPETLSRRGLARAVKKPVRTRHLVEAITEARRESARFEATT